jgi:hypothetical protein
MWNWGVRFYFLKFQDIGRLWLGISVMFWRNLFFYQSLDMGLAKIEKPQSVCFECWVFMAIAVLANDLTVIR